MDADHSPTPATTDAPEGFRQHRYVATPGACTLLLIRHGESAPAVPGQPFPLAGGHGDPALHPHGARQAERVAQRLRHERIDALYVTTLRRTHETAAPLAAALGIDPVVEPDLREVFLGDWEGGLLRQKAVERDPIFVQVYAQERWDVIPNAEPSDAFAARVEQGLQRIAGRHPDGRVAIVTHGGVIGAILHRITGSRPFAFAGADNASISEIVMEPHRTVLRRYNDISHLDGLD